ncbi:uncharacterized protein LOC126159898 [Schistocerca cancellata]|uniref:uncharacterized protein LOC126159898 n=1 Tax=Schistocerca cancellata TaxID=274614 RepID=UPI002117F6A8|nr:uncharacterized protein LOC126159898 [Schistocerca cancellata]
MRKVGIVSARGALSRLPPWPLVVAAPAAALDASRRHTDAAATPRPHLSPPALPACGIGDARGNWIRDPSPPPPPTLRAVAARGTAAPPGGGATGGVADSVAAAISRTGQPAMQAVICAAGSGGGARPEEVALSDGRRDTVEVRLNGAAGNGVRPGRRGAPYLGGAAPEDRDGRGGGSGHLLAGGRAGHCASRPATGARLLSAAAGRRTLPQVHVASAAQGAT